MKRNIVLAILVVVAMALWRIHVHHAQRAVPAATTTELRPFAVARATRSAPHAASLAGTVRDERGAAIAGARVCAAAASSVLPGELTRDPRCALTATNGAYTIADLYAADYQVSAMAKQFTLEPYAPNGPDQPVLFPLAAHEDRRGVDIVLHRGGVAVTGTVSDAGGGAIPRAHVRVDASWERYGGAAMVADTDDHGHYELWTRAGSVSLAASADGYAPTSRWGLAPGELDVVLVPEAILAGTVLDATTGAPLADVTVTATSVETSAYADSVLTDEHGRFTISRLQPGRYVASARAAHGLGTSDGSTPLGPGQRVDGVVVRLHPAHQIVARVIADGKTCPIATLGLIDERQGLQPEVVRDPDGTLHADGVLPGVYIPSPYCIGYRARDLYEPIIVTDHDVMATWTLEPGAELTGRVRTASGEPLANAEVAVWSVATAQRIPSSNGGDRATRSGEYTIRGLRPGRYQILVGRPDNATSLSGTATPDLYVDVPASGTVHRDIVMPDAAGGISGRVTTAHGSAGRVFVQARSSAGNTLIVGSDDAGRYEMRVLEPGTYELTVLAGADHGQQDSLTPEPVKVVVQMGQPTTANLVVEQANGTIRGRVVDDRGAPVPDAFVGLSFEAGEAPAIMGTRSDGDELLVGSDGRFVVEHLTKGPYTLRAHRRGGGEVFASHVAVGSDVTLTIKAAGDITGVARRAGGPIDDLHVLLFDLDTQVQLRDEPFFRTGGKFALRDVPDGNYRVVVATGGYEHASTIRVVDGQHVTLDIELEGTVTLVGRVIDARTQAPVAGIQIYATLASLNMGFRIAADLRDTSDVNGRFEVPNVPRGDLQISGRTFDDGTRTYDPATWLRTVTASEPDVIDLGDVLVVPTANGSRGDAGLSLDIGGEPRAARVVGVDPDGAAANAGIVVGDVVTAVDGFDVTGDRAEAARTLVTGDPGVSLALTLERGEIVTVVLAGPAP